MPNFKAIGTTELLMIWQIFAVQYLRGPKTPNDSQGLFVDCTSLNLRRILGDRLCSPSLVCFTLQISCSVSKRGWLICELCRILKPNFALFAASCKN